MKRPAEVRYGLAEAAHKLKCMRIRHELHRLAHAHTEHFYVYIPGRPTEPGGPWIPGSPLRPAQEYQHMSLCAVICVIARWDSAFDSAKPAQDVAAAPSLAGICAR